MENLSKISDSNYHFCANTQSKKIPHQSTENTLQRVPQRDSFSFTGKLSEKDLNGDMNIEVTNDFIYPRQIKGTILDKTVDLKIDTENYLFGPNKIKLSGSINGTPVYLEMKFYKLSGVLSEEHKDVLPYIKRLMVDKRNYDVEHKLLSLTL